VLQAAEITAAGKAVLQPLTGGATIDGWRRFLRPLDVLPKSVSDATGNMQRCCVGITAVLLAAAGYATDSRAVLLQSDGGDASGDSRRCYLRRSLMLPSVVVDATAGCLWCFFFCERLFVVLLT
jgi:hypothetical protein